MAHRRAGKGIAEQVALRDIRLVVRHPPGQQVRHRRAAAVACEQHNARAVLRNMLVKAVSDVFPCSAGRLVKALVIAVVFARVAEVEVGKPFQVCAGALDRNDIERVIPVILAPDGVRDIVIVIEGHTAIVGFFCDPTVGGVVAGLVNRVAQFLEILDPILSVRGLRQRHRDLRKIRGKLPRVAQQHFITVQKLVAADRVFLAGWLDFPARRGAQRDQRGRALPVFAAQHDVRGLAGNLVNQLRRSCFPRGDGFCPDGELLRSREGAQDDRDDHQRCQHDPKTLHVDSSRWFLVMCH